VATYSAQIDHYTPRRLAMAGELREGIEAQQLVLHLQPKIDLAHETVVGAEALVRWNHPTRGLIPPDAFIPLAEGSGLIRPLTSWVMSEALSVSRELQVTGMRLSMAVNLSARSLLDPHLQDDVQAALRSSGVEPDALILEITETSMVQDGASAMACLAGLREMGVTLSIDDFGTGYSSLAYLQRLPVSELKIDRSFVTDMDRDGGNLAIVRAAVDIGRALGLVVLAEGIESAPVAVLLRDIGCHLGQGYHFGRPMPRADFAAWASRNGSGDGASRTPHRQSRTERPRKRSGRDAIRERRPAAGI
jgi:EAL domain-containing protein (putative c-di-GMP-specific phosphodiesterase class I)